VNGNLFARRCPAPRFSSKARAVILECGTLDWSQISPDIFGSMIQAVVHPSQREGLGMHYTSVENIMKVIRPLFLDELEEAFDRADTTRKLERLLERIADIQIFDPACGSGNFLVVSYKELRKLEHRILQRLIDLDKKGRSLFKESALKLENFYGIEIDDFAHEIAILSLWLAKHQLNSEFEEIFGAEIPLIPLRDSGTIICGNAIRMEWMEVCDPKPERETYVCGNPPYQGARLQSPGQKADLAALERNGLRTSNLDYVSAWLIKGAAYVADVSRGGLAFVATNSVCQGDQVHLLWPTIYATGADISLAVQSFKWSNLARGGAGVMCVVIGLQRAPAKLKQLFSGATSRRVRLITPYLTEGATRTIVRRSAENLFGLPPMAFGSMANDGGALILERVDRDRIVSEYPSAERFMRPFLGAQEFIRGQERFTVWLRDRDIDEALKIPPIVERLTRVAAHRRASRRTATKRLAEHPYRFAELRHQDTPSIIVPRVSSERRRYVPLGFLGPDTVISDSANAIYDADPWLFGLIQSNMHMVWMRAVAGRLKSDIRYSTLLVYNTFPVPDLADEAKIRVSELAVAVLGARESFPDLILAELYDPEQMPAGLKKAHEDLDLAVDALYRDRPFDTDEDRLKLLFELYDRREGFEASHA
jgi:hypothetical protein